MKKFRVGDRVRESDILGEGRITELIRDEYDRQTIIGYMVMFDKTPDVRYNMGENPCFVFSHQLNKLT